MARETLSEIVERETVTDEADAPETDEDGDETEDDQPDEQIEPESQLPPEPMFDMDKAQRQIENESTRHEKRVREIMAGYPEPLEVCPLCQISGFVFPFHAEAPDEWVRKDAVDAYFGTAAPDLRANPDSTACETCEGWGEVLSGAKNATHRVIACPRCGGTGWKHTPTAPPTTVGTTGENYATVITTGAQNGGGETDAFGRPAGHPLWGQIPQFTGDN